MPIASTYLLYSQSNRRSQLLTIAIEEILTSSLKLLVQNNQLVNSSQWPRMHIAPVQIQLIAYQVLNH